MRTLWLPLLLLFALCLPACGGGGGDGEDDLVIETVDAPVVDAQTGFTALLTTGLGVSFGDDPLLVGDGKDLTLYAGIASFDLSGLPAGAVVQEAVLQLNQELTMGTAYVEFKRILIDHISFAQDLNTPGLQLFNTNALLGGVAVAVLASIDGVPNDTNNGVKVVDITSLVQRDLDEGRTLTQLRLRAEFHDLIDDEFDAVQFFSPAAGADGPRLTITYSSP